MNIPTALGFGFGFTCGLTGGIGATRRCPRRFGHVPVEVEWGSGDGGVVWWWWDRAVVGCGVVWCCVVLCGVVW